MNKVININFHGSIIPIEESAWELLRRYIDSLRAYFAQEQGRDEIINDIEIRIAELFLERLKKGAVCITDHDVQDVTAGIGHPEDLEAADSDLGSANANETAEEPGGGNKQEPRRLKRSANNQVVGGVAAGLAHYMQIDPSIIRLLFVLSLFAGFGFVVYLVMWVVLPQEAMADNAPKRLFRDMERKNLGGVAAGLAAYFNVEVWVPRIIFLLPFILGGFSSVFNNSWFDSDVLPDFLFSGFGGTLFVTYFVLWAVLPAANTAAEKLQMRGQKVDLHSIKNVVNSEMQHFKGKAGEWSKEMGKRTAEKAKMMQQDVTSSMQQFSAQASPAARRSGSGFLHAIGTLAKVFVFTLLGIIVLSLLIGLGGLITAVVSGHSVVAFLLEGETEQLLLWCTIVLFIGVPVIGMLMWLIRALRGVQTRNKYVPYIFSMLWVLGWVSLFALVSFAGKNFSSKARFEQQETSMNPAAGKVFIKVSAFEDEDLIRDWRTKGAFPRLSRKEDSIYSGNIRIRLLPSKDSLFHVKTFAIANGKSYEVAEQNARAIQYRFLQQDSILWLSKYLVFDRKEKFHNQQVLLVFEIPQGKKVELDERIDDFDWQEITVNTGNGFNLQIHDRDNDNDDDWDTGNEYVMLRDKLTRVAVDSSAR
ncbi:MAG TPA: PspC domain-containing protein [Chitinophagaceae bacterium]|nr:PspC domain-containing protein [Chitinophagaceae bacterium]